MPSASASRLDESLRRVLPIDTVYRIIGNALEKGKATAVRWHRGPVMRDSGLLINKVHTWRVDYASGSGKRPCLSPVLIRLTGRPLTKGRKSELLVVSVQRPGGLPVHVDIDVPCRQCEHCLNRRGQLWYFRALAETTSATRTWFGTLTLSPDQHVRVAAACRVQHSQNGDDFDALPSARQFAERHKCISREITLYLKRVRKHYGSEFRFCCVAEAHKTGLPHYHMLVHQVGPTAILHRLLSEQWRVGFSQWKLVRTPTAAGYATKYLSKSAQARVRASKRYGHTTTSDIEIIQDDFVTPSDFHAAAPFFATATAAGPHHV